MSFPSDAAPGRSGPRVSDARPTARSARRISRKDAFPSRAQTLALAYWVFHYLKRIAETVFVHKFSHATMPISGMVRNCTYYGLAGFVVSYFINHPAYTNPNLMVRLPTLQLRMLLTTHMAAWPHPGAPSSLAALPGRRVPGSGDGHAGRQPGLPPASRVPAQGGRHGLPHAHVGSLPLHRLPQLHGRDHRVDLLLHRHADPPQRRIHSAGDVPGGTLLLVACTGAGTVACTAAAMRRGLRSGAVPVSQMGQWAVQKYKRLRQQFKEAYPARYKMLPPFF